MKSLVKSLSLVSLLIMFLSCEVLSPILTKNYFEDFKDYNPLGDVIPESDWNDVADKDAKLEEYIDLVFSDEKDAKSLYNQLKGEKNYKRAMADDLMLKLQGLDSPVYGSETFSDDLKTYQKTAMALARMEVYGSEEMAITGFENIIVDFATGEQTDSLTNETLMGYLFEAEATSDFTEDDLKAMDIESLYNAGIALSYLGGTIIDKDNPVSEYVTESDAIMILISSIMNTIITDSVVNFANEDAVIDALVSGINSGTGTFDNNLEFPQDKDQDVNNEDYGKDPIVQYLGENGAVVYAATGYELPDAELVMGGNE